MLDNDGSNNSNNNDIRLILYKYAIAKCSIFLGSTPTKPASTWQCFVKKPAIDWVNEIAITTIHTTISFQISWAIISTATTTTRTTIKHNN